MIELLVYPVGLLLALVAGVCVGRDLLARENRRLRQHRDELLAAQARAWAAIPNRSE